jgi:hypothetical protein
MDDGRSDGSVTGEPTRLGAAEHAREGDVIQGLRSGLVLSLAIWATLLTVGALIFS